MQVIIESIKSKTADKIFSSLPGLVTFVAYDPDEMSFTLGLTEEVRWNLTTLSKGVMISAHRDLKNEENRHVVIGSLEFKTITLV